MLETARVIATCALYRQESRGVHYREDFPKKEAAWLVNVNAHKENGEVKLFKSPIVINKIYPMDPPKNEP
jgi:succinate dehydrogenase / fumarate reductase flavoprotein subunit